MQNVDVNLFNPSYVYGNLNTVPWLVDTIGNLSVRVISVVGFLIVICTILKNCANGLYAVSPKFWDRVDEVHRLRIEEGEISGGGWGEGKRSAYHATNSVKNFLGGISYFLLSICPNLKALTDFDADSGNGNVDPGQYFLKAIPIMCLHIFIGVMIFFGYPAQIAEKASDLGRGLLDAAINNIDPTAWLEKLPSGMYIPWFNTRGAKNDFDQLVNDISVKAFRSVKGHFNDMTEESQQSVAYEVESWVESCLNSIATYTDIEAYKPSFETRLSKGEPDLSRVHDKHNNGIHQYAFSIPIADLGTGSAISEEDWYLRFDVSFKEKAVSVFNASTQSFSLNIGSSTPVEDKDNGAWEVGLTGITTSDQIKLVTSGTATGYMKDGTKAADKIKISYDQTNNKLILTWQDKSNCPSEFSKLKFISGITGMQYSHMGEVITINKLTFNGGSYTFSCTSEGANIPNFDFGDAPTDGSLNDKGSSNKTGTSIDDDEEEGEVKDDDDDDDDDDEDDGITGT